MISTLVFAVGLVLAIEGLVLALAPSRIEELLETFTRMPVETRRLIGLAALGGGVVLIWIARSFGG